MVSFIQSPIAQGVKSASDDTSGGPLIDEIIAGTGITVSEVDVGGGNKKIRIATAGSGGAVYVAASDPTAQNDGVDTAGIGRVFEVSEFWLNSTTNDMFQILDNSTNAAVWRNTTTDYSRYTDTVYVAKSNTRTNQNGSTENPYSTIQAALDHFGQPTDAADFQRRILIKIVEGGVYTENLTVPHHSIVIQGIGVTIDGNITREISNEKEYGVSSSTFRGCLTLEGLTDARDNHQITRVGIRVTGDYRCKVIATETGNTTHDTCFINTEFQGTVTSDDGTVNGGAPSTGTEVLYATGCKFSGDIEGRGFYCQRWKDTQIDCDNLTIGWIVMFRNVIFENGDIWSGFNPIAFTVTNFETSNYHFMECFFRNVTIDTGVVNIYLDTISKNSWLSNVTINTGTITLTDLETLSDIATATDDATTNIDIGQAANIKAAFIEYDLRVDTRRRVGLLYVTHDGTNSDVRDEYVDLNSDIPIIIGADISGGVLRLNLVATSVGGNATFSYIVRSI